MNIAVIGHVPFEKHLNPDVFLANLEACPPKCPLILFGARGIPIEPPPMSMGIRWYYQSVMWLTACRIAQKHGHEWMIYIEADCRFRPGWDERMIAEFQLRALSIRPYGILGGGMVVWNPCNAGHEAYRKFVRHFGIEHFPVYGSRGIDQHSGTAVSVNGALGLYHVPTMIELFPEIGAGRTIQLAREIGAYDQELGKRLWQKFDVGAYDCVVNLPCIYSSYGNVLTTEAERLQMLRSGGRVAVHPVKSRETL